MPAVALDAAAAAARYRIDFFPIYTRVRPVGAARLRSRVFTLDFDGTCEQRKEKTKTAAARDYKYAGAPCRSKQNTFTPGGSSFPARRRLRCSADTFLSPTRRYYYLLLLCQYICVHVRRVRGVGAEEVVFGGFCDVLRVLITSKNDIVYGVTNTGVYHVVILVNIVRLSNRGVRPRALCDKSSGA